MTNRLHEISILGIHIAFFSLVPFLFSYCHPLPDKTAVLLALLSYALFFAEALILLNKEALKRNGRRWQQILAGSCIIIASSMLLLFTGTDNPLHFGQSISAIRQGAPLVSAIICTVMILFLFTATALILLFFQILNGHHNGWQNIICYSLLLTAILAGSIPVIRYITAHPFRRKEK